MKGGEKMPKTKKNSLDQEIKRALRTYRSIPQRILPVQYSKWISLPVEVRLRASEVLAQEL